MNIISELEAAEAERINAIRTIPEFSAGDTLRVNVKVTEGTRTRVQAYEGVCIARSGAGIQENFTGFIQRSRTLARVAGRGDLIEQQVVAFGAGPAVDDAPDFRHNLVADVALLFAELGAGAALENLDHLA